MAEIEAKFLLREPEELTDFLAFLGESGYAVEKRGTATHVDTYFDTPDWAVLRAGWAYRCRQRGTESTLTLKSTGEATGAVFVRDEIGQPAADTGPAPKNGLPPGPVQKVLEPIVGGTALRKLFSIKTRRTRYGLRPPGDAGTSIELDVDETRIRAKQTPDDATGRLRFTELELELEAGDVASIGTLATILADRDGLRMAKLSKFERGLHTAGLTLDATRPVADASAASPADPVLLLLFDYLGQQRNKMLAYQPVAWEGLDPEGVHKMRVATRRVRALLRSFREILAEDLENSLEAELRWLAGQLGEARDTDICARDVARFNKTLTPAAAIAAAEYAEHLEQTRANAYARLALAFESDRYLRLMDDFETFCSDGPATGTRQSWGELSIEDCAERLVAETAGKVIRRGDAIDESSPAKKLHRLRIIAKRLRYLLEFFSLAQPGRWTKPIAALQNLHDLLGDHQDRVTSRALLADYAESIPSGTAPRDLLLAIGRLMQIEDERLAEARARFPTAWKRFRKSMR